LEIIIATAMRQNLLTKFYLRQFILPQVFILSSKYGRIFFSIVLSLTAPTKFPMGWFSDRHPKGLKSKVRIGKERVRK